MKIIQLNGQNHVTPLPPNLYHEYISSHLWRSRTDEMLKMSGGWCAAIPILRVGRFNPSDRHPIMKTLNSIGRWLGYDLKDSYAHYARNHAHYNTLGCEVYGRDVFVLSRAVDQGIFHGILSGFARPSQQRRFPNRGQRLFNYWCSIPRPIKLPIFLGAIATTLVWLILSQVALAWAIAIISHRLT